MAQAGPSSTRKATEQKRKRNTKKIRKSVLDRQAVELLDNAALEYVTPFAAAILRAALTDGVPGTPWRSQSILGSTDI